MSAKSLPCSQMWEKFMINAIEGYIRTCWDRDNSYVTVDEIRHLGPDLFTKHPDIINDRECFIDKNKLPYKCKICINNYGNTKDNLHNLWKNDVFDENKLDSLREADLIDKIDFYLDRTCNQTCLYCNKEHSTDWASLLGEKTSNKNVNQEWHDAILDAFYAYIKRRLSSNNAPIEYGFAGGEPFLNLNLPDIINKIIDLHRVYGRDTKCGFEFTTNLNVKPLLIDRFIAIANKNPKFDWKISCSLDAPGRVGEEIRSGLNFKVFDANFRKLLKETDMHIDILPSISNVSVSSMPSLLTYIIETMEEYQIPDNRWNLGANLINHPTAMHVSTLPISYKHYIDLSIKLVEGSHIDYYFIPYLMKIHQLIGTRRDKDSITNVKEFFEYNGRLRGKDYWCIFESLSDIVSENA